MGNCGKAFCGYYGHIEGKVKLPKDYNISGRIYNELLKNFYKKDLTNNKKCVIIKE